MQRRRLNLAMHGLAVFRDCEASPQNGLKSS